MSVCTSPVDERNTKGAVPRFSSFRPKAPPANKSAVSQRPLSTPSQGEVRTHERDNRAKGEHRKSRHHGDDHHRKRHHRSRSRDRLEDRSRTESRNKPSEAEITPWDEGPELYTIDVEGDYNNLTYGSLHRYSIPAYRRSGYGSVLGLAKGNKINRDATTEREIVIDYPFMSGSRERRLLYKQEQPSARELRVVKPAINAAETDRSLEYIPIRNRKRKRGSESPEPSANEVDYRSIEGKAKPDARTIDEDLEYITDSSETLREPGTSDADREVKERNASLSRRTNTEPSNIEAWLDLIEHQEVMVRLGQGRNREELSASEQRNLADIRISMYEQALKTVKTPQGRVRLILGLLEQGSKVWEPSKLSTKWQEALQEHAASLAVWTKYLDFVQTNFVSFRYESCKTTFRDCLDVIASHRKLSSIDTTEDNYATLILYVVLRMTTMMREAGYREHATAVWQALLEFHLFRPAALAQRDAAESEAKRNDCLQAFEDFWESEVPRIGDAGTSGWADYYVNGGSPPDPADVNIQTVVEPDNCFRSFAEGEELHANAFKEPGRTLDDAGDDPYHVVLYSDLQDILRLVSGNLPHALLVAAFIRFSSLLPLYDIEPSAWKLDPFLRSDVPDHARPLMEQYQTTTDRLFTDLAKTSGCERTRRTLEAIAAAADNDIVAEYYLAYEWCHHPTTAARIAKRLLKRRSTSLRLYNAYGIVESRSGNRSAANRVFSTAIGMSKTLPLSEQSDVILLWRTWIWEGLREGNMPAAALRATSIGGAPPSERGVDSHSDLPDLSPSALLRATRTLKEGRDHTLSTGIYQHAVLHTECLALLAYLQASSNRLEAVSEVFRQTSQPLVERGLEKSFANELNHQARAQMVAQLIIEERHFKPSIISKDLTESITLFPYNTILLQLYAANEARFRIDDRLRGILRDVVLKDKEETIIGWFFAVWSEMKRGEGFGSTAHSVRATFDRAVGSNSGKHSMALWTCYVEFEHGLGDLQRAKAVYYRGLTNLPWAKQYIMLAFTHLRDVMTFEELRRVYNVLLEKELRVHIDLTDVLDEIDAQKERSLKHDEEALLINMPEDASSVDEG